jgi:predicted transposase YdaD
MLREETKKGEKLETAAKNIVEYCIRNGIMSDFLSEHGGEVVSMLYTEWNLDDAVEVGREEGIEIGVAKGREEGIEIGAKKMLSALRALNEGKSIAEAAQITGLSPEVIKELRH